VCTEFYKSARQGGADETETACNQDGSARVTVKVFHHASNYIITLDGRVLCAQTSAAKNSCLTTQWVAPTIYTIDLHFPNSAASSTLKGVLTNDE
jgi:hypothetical protein